MSVIETERDLDHIAGFAFLAQLGKRVLRPGGAALSGWLIDELAIDHNDDVVEFAPGLGQSAEVIRSKNPATYIAVDRDVVSERAVAPTLRGPEEQFLRTSVSRTGLRDHSCDVGVGEALLTMHPYAVKENIMREFARIVRPGGRIGLHEVAFQLDDLDHRVESDEVEITRISAELTSHFKVAFGALTLPDWESLLSKYGFSLRGVHDAPLRLLEPSRIIADEGVYGAARFTANVVTNPQAMRRIGHMRGAMRRNAAHLRAVALVADRIS